MLAEAGAAHSIRQGVAPGAGRHTRHSHSSRWDGRRCPLGGEGGRASGRHLKRVSLEPGLGSAGGAGFTQCRPPCPGAVTTCFSLSALLSPGFRPGPDARPPGTAGGCPAVEASGGHVSDRNQTCVCSRLDPAAQRETRRDGGRLVTSDGVTPSALTHRVRGICGGTGVTPRAEEVLGHSPSRMTGRPGLWPLPSARGRACTGGRTSLTAVTIDWPSKRHFQVSVYGNIKMKG